MVYYGVVSKGCQRCRQRKVKCDLRKPGCLRCEKAKTQCPGFRNLADVVFRDESERIIRKARALYRASHNIEQPKSLMMQDAVIQDAVLFISTCSSFSTSQPHTIIPQRSESQTFNFLPPTSISYALSQPINELGAHFFFANYTWDEPPLSEAYHSWLTKTYFEDRPNHALRAAIEAAGMAGISNTLYAPHVACKSKEQYGRALAATKQALSDPVESAADTTLIAVILLGLFELITCETWDQYRSWIAHIKGATALLQLRGQEQLTYERGGQLYTQLRSQLLYACMLQDFAVPQAVVQISQEVRPNAIGERLKKIRPGNLGDMCSRLLHIRSAIKSGEITDQEAIRKASEMDRDLEAWRARLEPSWSYTTIDADDVPAGTYFDGKRHVYSNLWTAQLWNNWRALRILVNRIILQIESGSDASDSAQKSTSLSLIHQLSTEICVSAANFLGSPRASGLIWPLFVVSEEPLNPLSERCWAVEQLRRVNSSMGIRQAGLLADTISQSLNVPQGNPCQAEGAPSMPEQGILEKMILDYETDFKDGKWMEQAVWLKKQLDGLRGRVLAAQFSDIDIIEPHLYLCH